MASKFGWFVTPNLVTLAIYQQTELRHRVDQKNWKIPEERKIREFDASQIETKSNFGEQKNLTTAEIKSSKSKNIREPKESQNSTLKKIRQNEGR